MRANSRNPVGKSTMSRWYGVGHLVSKQVSSLDDDDDNNDVDRLMPAIFFSSLSVVESLRLMTVAKEAGEYVLCRLLNDPFSTIATRANPFASVSVRGSTLKLLWRVRFLISVEPACLGN
jgi:hypothetical protein